MAWTVKLAGYEGPLDLLLDLLAKRQLDIAEIAVAQVTAQYLEYLQGLPQENLELYSEFLVIGATLLALKARLLLPQEQTEPEDSTGEVVEDPGQTLVERLACYKRFREAAGVLEELARRRDAYWDRGLDSEAYRLVLDQIDPLAAITLDDLERVFKNIRLRHRQEAPAISPPRPEVSLAQLHALIRRRLAAQDRVSLHDLFAGSVNDPRGLILGLLALLILSHRGEVRLEQDELWGPIYVCARALSPEGAVN